MRRFVAGLSSMLAEGHRMKRDVEVITTGQRVPIPRTHRATWPGSTPAATLTSDADVMLTAWLRPKKGGELDVARACKLGASPPLQRSYMKRAALRDESDADPAERERFGAYCANLGIRVVESHWRSVAISGPLERLIDAFGATVATFFDGNGKHFRHRSDSLHVPHDIAVMLCGVFGLHQWPRSSRLGALQRHATPLTAGDVVKRYAFPDADGAGQTIGVTQFRGEFKADDFDRCMQAQGVTAARPIVKRVDDAALTHEFETTKDLEAALDVQIIGSLAPAARIVIYEAPDDERGFLDAIRTALFDAEFAPSVLSISYGWPEHLWTPAALDVLDELFTVAALVGVSVFCSSGDNGAELDYDGKPHVLAPASSSFVHACGATELSSDAANQAETAWEKTGGGFSTHYDVPPWQGIATSSAAAYEVAAGRGVPDMAAQQLPGYCVYLDGVELAIGGTSAVAPMWSALAARINQRLGVPIGLFSPMLYASRAKLLRDVTDGSNGPFQARPGWNPCTGLGVPIGTAIEAALRTGGSSA
ncbi:MAG: S53 family peptidase [Candidatus Eremiobacteraeota bacterium]|nr:S53 family peptidase [Candidatus Eremiobacteraeota bacterium]